MSLFRNKNREFPEREEGIFEKVSKYVKNETIINEIWIKSY